MLGNWLRRQDSNLEPPDSESGDLPVDLRLKDASPKGRAVLTHHLFGCQGSLQSCWDLLPLPIVRLSGCLHTLELGFR